MTNVVPFKPAATMHPSRLDVNKLLRSLRALWLADAINQDALFLGTQIAAMMQTLRSDTVTTCHREASATFTTIKGSVFSGRVSPRPESFTIALQQLHFIVQIRSSLFASSLNDEVPEYHFTTDSSLQSPAFSDKTPLHFFFDPADQDDLLEMALNKLREMCENGGIEQPFLPVD